MNKVYIIHKDFDCEPSYVMDVFSSLESANSVLEDMSDGYLSYRENGTAQRIFWTYVVSVEEWEIK